MGTIAAFTCGAEFARGRARGFKGHRISIALRLLDLVSRLHVSDQTEQEGTAADCL